MSVETKDFADIIVPILEAGTWTNLGLTPKIITKNQGGPDKISVRGNKNYRVEVRNELGVGPEMAYNGEVIHGNLTGRITPVHTANAKRNYMKTDVQAILKAAGISYSIGSLDDNPKKRNKEMSGFLITFVSC